MACSTNKKQKQKERVARRVVKDGFPITAKFTSANEINDYLHGEKITCLLCGRVFKQLIGHLYQIHGMTADEYKDMYGLPYRTGLSCEPTKVIYRAKGLKQEQLEHLKAIRTPENRIKLMASASRQRISGLKAISSKDNLNAIEHKGSPFNASHGEVILTYMEDNDCSVRKAIRDTNIMKSTAFYNLIKLFPELNAKDRIKHGAKGVRSPIKGNPEVIEKIKSLRIMGKGFKEIGVILGIHEEYAGFLARGAIRKRKPKS